MKNMSNRVRNTIVAIVISLVLIMVLVAPGPLNPSKRVPKPLATPTPVLQPTITPTATLQPAATLVPTATLAATETSAGPDWDNIPEPVGVYDLPKDLDQHIRYEQPPENCSAKNDPEVTCSTKEGQATHGDFTLRVGFARAFTGDDILIFQNDAGVTSRPDPLLNHTLWIIVNVSASNITLMMDAPNGSWRANLSARWTPELVAALRDNTLQHFLVGPNPIPTPNPVGPTPVVNCGDPNACDQTNVMVGVWDGLSWHWSNGLYNDNFTGLLNWAPAK